MPNPEDFGIGRLFRIVRDAVIVANAKTERIILWNECAGEIFGYSEEEALELPLHALVPETLRQNHRTGLARYQDTGKGNLINSGTPVELAALHKNGDEVPIELTLTAVPDLGNGDRFALAIIRDITDRKTAEAARLELREVEIRQEQAMEANDTVVQKLATAKLAIEMGEADRAAEIIDDALDEVKRSVGHALEATEKRQPIKPGDLRRSKPT